MSIRVTGTVRKYQCDFLFEVDGHKVCGIADPTHTQKAMRNALYNNKVIEFDPKDVKEFKLPGSKVKWEHIQKVFEYDQEYQLGIARHLKREYLYDLTSYMKMKVPPARHVLSRATSTAIRWYHKHYPHIFGEEYLVTAHFCALVGEWNDTINNRQKSMAIYANNANHRKGVIRNFMNVYVRMKLHSRQKRKLKDSQKSVILASFSMFWLADKLLIELKFHFFLTAKGNTDVVEHHHSDARSFHTSPTPLDYKRDCKIMSVTHYTGHVKHSNYDIDESGFYLADIESIKEIVTEQDKENNLVVDLAKVEFFTPPDFNELAALANFGGWVFRVTIVCPPKMKKIKPSLRSPKCPVCLKAFVIDCIDDDQEVNDFIDMKEYREGTNVRCTVLANEMFLHAEKIFRSAWAQFSKQKDLTEQLTAAVISGCTEKFEDIPICHLKNILGKFVHVRLYFYADYIDRKLQKVHKRAIRSSLNASKSSKAANLATIPQKARKAKKGNVIPKRPTVDQEPENLQELENIQAPANVQEPEQAQNKARKPGTARKRKFPTKGPLDLISKGGKIITKRSKREIKKPSRFLDGVNEHESSD